MRIKFILFGTYALSKNVMPVEKISHSEDVPPLFPNGMTVILHTFHETPNKIATFIVFPAVGEQDES